MLNYARKLGINLGSDKFYYLLFVFGLFCYFLFVIYFTVIII